MIDLLGDALGFREKVRAKLRYELRMSSVNPVR